MSGYRKTIDVEAGFLLCSDTMAWDFLCHEFSKAFEDGWRIVMLCGSPMNGYLAVTAEGTPRETT